MQVNLDINAILPDRARSGFTGQKNRMSGQGIVEKTANSF